MKLANQDQLDKITEVKMWACLRPMIVIPMPYSLPNSNNSYVIPYTLTWSEKKE